MKGLIIYFSRADENYSVGFINKGNTEVVAEYIKDYTGADMFKVEPAISYSKDYNTCIKEAQERASTHIAPIQENIIDVSNYDILYIGSPVYWGGMPEEMFTALKGIDFTSKKIKIFVTHEGSGVANIPSQIKSICSGASIDINALAVYGHQVNDCREKVKEWLEYNTN